MDDMIKCAKCGKETNKYSPVCEYCHAPLEYAPLKPEDLGTSTIEDKGHAAHEALKKYATKKCPYCAEEILLEAVKCRFCGEKMPRPFDAGALFRNFMITAASLALIAVLVFGALMGYRYIKTAMFFIGGSKDNTNGQRAYLLKQVKSPEISKAIKSDPVKLAYLNTALILTSTGTMDETGQDGKTAKYAYGTIKNGGDRMIIRLQVTVYFIGKNGKIIAEQSAWPIYGAKGKPDSLKADGSRDFQFPMESPGEEWSGRVMMRVTDLELL